MMMPTLICLMGLTLSSSVQLLDDFDYADSAAVQQVWRTSAERGGDAPSIRMLTENEQTAVELPVPFATQPELSRVYMDRQVNLNMAAMGEFKLMLTSTM